MTDKPEAEGYSLVIERGKVQVNLVKRWLDDAIRVETERQRRARGLASRPVYLRWFRARRGIKIYVDGTRGHSRSCSTT